MWMWIVAGVVVVGVVWYFFLNGASTVSGFISNTFGGSTSTS
jgi:hypothetical protein